MDSVSAAALSEANPRVNPLERALALRSKCLQLQARLAEAATDPSLVDDMMELRQKVDTAVAASNGADNDQRGEQEGKDATTSAEAK